MAWLDRIKIPTITPLESKHCQVFGYYSHVGSLKFCGESWENGRVTLEEAGFGFLWSRPSDLCFRGGRGGHVMIGLRSPAGQCMVGAKMAAASAASIRERQTGTGLFPSLPWGFVLAVRTYSSSCRPHSVAVRAVRKRTSNSLILFSDHREPFPFWVFREEMPLAWELGSQMCRRRGFRGERVAAVLLLSLSYWASKGHGDQIWHLAFPALATYEVFGFVSARG